jgi:hypothetical protein
LALLLRSILSLLILGIHIDPPPAPWPGYLEPIIQSTKCSIPSAFASILLSRLSSSVSGALLSVHLQRERKHSPAYPGGISNLKELREKHTVPPLISASWGDDDDTTVTEIVSDDDALNHCDENSLESRAAVNSQVARHEEHGTVGTTSGNSSIALCQSDISPGKRRRSKSPLLASTVADCSYRHSSKAVPSKVTKALQSDAMSPSLFLSPPPKCQGLRSPGASSPHPNKSQVSNPLAVESSPSKAGHRGMENEATDTLGQSPSRMNMSHSMPGDPAGSSCTPVSRRLFATPGSETSRGGRPTNSNNKVNSLNGEFKRLHIRGEVNVN